MIRKFQQGGAQDPIMLFVQALALTLQADPQLIVQAAQLNPQALETAVLTYQQTLDINQAAQAFTKALQQQVQAARHGAKLQYLKSLKHQCAEDEELYYYKKGGSLGCGCKKKEGGEVTKVLEGAVMKFKKTIKKNNNSTKELTYDEKTGKMRPATQAEIEQRKKNRKDASQGKGEGTPQRKKGGELKKDCGGSKLKKGAKVCPKCGKVHAAGMGCAVAKFKMHRLGGSLNGVPFYLAGTSKRGISLYFPQRPISGAEAYMNDIAINDPLYKMYNNKANAYSNEVPTISNVFNTLLNKLKAYYYGNKAAIKGYADKVDKYSRYLWNRGNYKKAIFGSPFVPIVRDYQPNKPFINK